MGGMGDNYSSLDVLSREWGAVVTVEPIIIHTVGDPVYGGWTVSAMWPDYHGATLHLEAKAATIHEAVSKIERQKAHADRTLAPELHAATA